MYKFLILHVKMDEMLRRQSRALSSLQLNDAVSIQDQTGHYPRRWSKTGKIVESCGHDSYLVKIDGSNRITKRNRQFLRKLTPYKCDSDDYTPTSPNPSWQQANFDAPDRLEDAMPIDTSLSKETVKQVPQRAPTLSSPDTVDHPASEPPIMDRWVPDELSTSTQLPPTDTLLDPVREQVPLQPKHPRIREKWIINPKYVTTPDKSLQN